MKCWRFHCSDDTTVGSLSAILGLPVERLWLPLERIATRQEKEDTYVLHQGIHQVGVANVMEGTLVCGSDAPLSVIDSPTGATFRVTNSTELSSSTHMIVGSGAVGFDTVLPKGQSVVCVDLEAASPSPTPHLREGAKGLLAKKRRSKTIKKDQPHSSDGKDLEALIQLCGVPVSSPLVKRMRRLTKQKIESMKDFCPLRYLDSSSAPFIHTDQLMWHRPEPHLLYHMLQTNSDGVEQRTAASRNLIVCFLDDVLLRLSRRDGGPMYAQFGPLDTSSAAVKMLTAHALRGFRIVLVEHLPSLHYGSAAHITSTLESIHHASSELMTGVPNVSLLLVTASYIAGASHGSGREFIFPRPGAWNYFLHHLNSSLLPDVADSFVMGSSRRTHAVMEGVHSRFARAIGLRFVDACALL